MLIEKLPLIGKIARGARLPTTYYYFYPITLEIFRQSTTSSTIYRCLFTQHHRRWDKTSMEAFYELPEVNNR